MNINEIIEEMRSISAQLENDGADIEALEKRFAELETLKKQEESKAHIRKVSQTLVGRSTEFPHYVGKQYCHCQTVGNAVEAAQGVADGMDIAHTAAGKGTAGIECATLHILPRR